MGTSAPLRPEAELRVTELTFLATCPTCTQERRQNGFSFSTVRRLLKLGLPIDGYCGPCGQLFQLSEPDRSTLAESLLSTSQ